MKRNADNKKAIFFINSAGFNIAGDLFKWSWKKAGSNILKAVKTISIFIVLLAMLTLSAVVVDTHSAFAADDPFPRIDLLPSEGPVNSKVFVRIYDYEGDKAVIIFFGSVSAVAAGTCVVANTTTDDSGYGIASFNIDLLPGGRYVIMADDGVNAKTAYFKITPKIKLEQTNGFVGDDVIISGNGFAAEKPVSAYLDGVRMETGDSDTNGQITNLRFALPSCCMGEHDLKVQDSDGNYTTTTYTVRQKMTVTPAVVQVGNEINISGTGFEVKDVTIYLDDEDVAVTRPESDGSFSIKLVVPACGEGTHKIKADDGVNRSYFDLTVASSLVVTPDNGNIGTQVSVQGFGFRPGLPVTALYDNIELDAPIINSVGSFTFSFRVPKSKSGAHIISVTDSVNSMKSNFSVESVPPVAPTLVSPLDSSKVTKEIHFEWNPVSDPSGIVYTLELADDAQFSNIILSEASLAAPFYDLNDDGEMLVSRNTPYYWRVKAVDGASNTSAWSAIGTFYKAITVNSIVSNMPSWTKYILLFLGVVLVGFMLFLFSRALKRIRNSDEEEEFEEEFTTEESTEWGYESESDE